MSKSESDEIIERLDRLIATIQVAFAPEIQEQREQLDDLSRQILARTEEWIQAGTLTRKLAAATGAGTSTIGKRLADLTSRGILRRSGGGPTTQYQRTGVL